MQIKIGSVGLIALFSLLMICCGSSKKKKTKVVIESQNFYEYSGLTEKNTWIIGNEKDWVTLQNKMFEYQKPKPDLGITDFENFEWVIIAFGEKSSGGYSYKAIEYFHEDDILHFVIGAPKREGNTPVTMALTQPVLICKIPKTDAQIINYHIVTIQP